MKKITIGLFVILGLLVGAGLGVLIWWLIPNENVYETILLEGGIGDVKSTAAFTRIHGHGDMFWWFYPTLADSPTRRPVILWLHGITETPSSFLANFGMFGPYDKNLNRRSDSWVNEYNLLFVDAPLGTGFSTSNIPQNSSTAEFPGVDQNAEYLFRTLQSFYDVHEEYRFAPLYICSQGDGSQLALALTLKIVSEEVIWTSVRGIILGSPVISPALALTKLGFYLNQLGYVDSKGKATIESFSEQTNSLVQSEAFQEAFDQFTSLGNFVNEKTGAVAVNLAHIVEKLTRDSSNRDYFGEKAYLGSVFHSHINYFMDTVVAPALGISETVKYDSQREAVVRAFGSSYMKPIVDKVEHILKNTNLEVNIYNGNLDAVSNTPGQLEWVNQLSWSGQAEFLNTSRTTIAVNRLIEGYSRESRRLRFYWINVAGQLVPLDNPVGIRRVLSRITNR
ncbi:retinoid-inducible serine carboxypeptidase-like [Pararge aegeria]|uniref:Jg13913 protein n=1 Tax=Pararge aegeria aegeria TaxID=348720 RepID=A0A8S4SKT2_9NEOP|nr:retinoid-inducible serine carboxypeptidase-like [Pararge aegeria]CAH2263460.1 jg13913 [Pararge aegeria aegeria]